MKVMKPNKNLQIKELQKQIERIEKNVHIIAEAVNRNSEIMVEDHAADEKLQAMVYQLLAHNKLIEVEEVSS